MVLFRFFLLILLIFLTPKNYLYSKNKPEEIGIQYHPQSILGFTKRLISQKDYYRGYKELQRLNSFYPGYIREDIFYASEMFLLFQGKEYAEILQKKTNSDNCNVQLINIIFKTDVYLERSEYRKADLMLNVGGCLDYSHDLKMFIYKRRLVSNLLLNRIDETRKSLVEERNKIDKASFNKYKELIKYSDKNMQSLLNPFHSLFLGVVPGLGYIKAGDEATGIIAFILVSVLSALTYFSFSTDNKPVGIFFGAMTVTFYSGSIIGGYLASRRFNNRIRKNTKENIFYEMSLVDDREYILTNYGIFRAGKR